MRIVNPTVYDPPATTATSQPLQTSGLGNVGDPIDFGPGGYLLAGLAGIPNWALYSAVGLGLYFALFGKKHRSRKPKSDDGTE